MQATIRSFTGANPVSIAEFRHQRFIIQRGRVGGLWILLAALLVIPALLSALLLTLLMLAADLILPALVAWSFTLDAGAGQLFGGIANLCVTALIISNLAMYPVVTLVTLSLAANSIRREKAGFTWDTLRLTEIGAWRIVTGKWRASLRALNGDHGMITLLRSGMLAAYLLTNYVLVESGMTELVAPPSGYSLAMLILLVLTVVYGLLDAALTAALGLPGTLPGGETGFVTAGVALSLRIIISIAAAAWLVFTVHNLVYSGLVTVLLLSVIGILAYLLLIGASLLIARWLVR